MQFYINHGLGWLYQLLSIFGVVTFGGLSIFLIFKVNQLEDHIKRLKEEKKVYEKELAQYEIASEEFYEKVWAE